MVLLEKAGRTKERESDAVERERENEALSIFFRILLAVATASQLGAKQRGARERGSKEESIQFFSLLSASSSQKSVRL